MKAARKSVLVVSPYLDEHLVDWLLSNRSRMLTSTASKRQAPTAMATPTKEADDDSD